MVVAGGRDEQALTRYQRLAGALEVRRCSLALAATEAGEVAVRFPSAPAIEGLRARAEGCYVEMPRRGWALAYIAHAAALALPPSRSLREHTHVNIECSLTLALTLNTLGHFSEALQLLSPLHLDSVHSADQSARLLIEQAIASTYLGQLPAARSAIARAREHLAHADSPSLQASCDLAEALLCYGQSRYGEAENLLRAAGDLFARCGCEGEAALAWCHLAEVLRFIDTQEALTYLDRSRAVPSCASSAVHVARCDHIQAFIYSELNRYSESLVLYGRAWSVFQQEGMEFLAARVLLDQGLDYSYLTRYEEALDAYHRARAAFSAQRLEGYVGMCELNIAIIYYHLDRYEEALALYEQIAERAKAEGRLLRAARCYTNMGLCYDRLGRYDQALTLHERARLAFLEEGNPVYVARCQENLAGTYRTLGRYEQALLHYEEASEVFAEADLPVQSAHCRRQLAELHLALGRTEEAQSCLEAACRVYTEVGMAVYQAVCFRQLALAAHGTREPEQVVPLLNLARETFIRHEMLVELALCDVIEGEFELKRGRIAGAEARFQDAHAVLVPGFPDQAWRVEDGLARCALANHAPATALEHYVRAAGFIGRARSTLPTERLGTAFFAHRQHVFRAAIELALQQGEVEQALTLVDNSKARTLLTRHAMPRGHQPDDAYVSRLVERESLLRHRLLELRNQLTISEATERVSARGEKARMLDEVNEVSQDYEEVVDQLRLLSAIPLGPSVTPFSLTMFRQVASSRLPSGWTCLSYFLDGSTLVIFSLAAKTLQVYRRHLLPEDSHILSQCASSDPDRRELVYRGTLRGFAVPSQPGGPYLKRLGDLLLPDEFVAGAPGPLVLVPHGLLHGLPFHSLSAGEATLLERGPLFYAPSLQVLQALWAQGEARQVRSDQRALVLGLETFGERAPPLTHTRREVQEVASAVGTGGQALFGADVTVMMLRELNAIGMLANFDLLHFATHAVAEPQAPMLSRVLLHDGDLVALDILGLNLASRLVTLSSCHSAVGEVGAGDEMMTLAHAFFYAGTQAVLATLWAVEDGATSVLMRLFYERLREGEPIPQALRLAQLAMMRAGYNPYQWAPFIVVGDCTFAGVAGMAA
jgi:tetratricopeptide (TPR) repeat protein